MQNRAPFIVAIVLLLSPLVYLGSYLALAEPHYAVWVGDPSVRPMKIVAHYRLFGQRGRAFFWPLEQIDRKIRPEKWTRNYQQGDYIPATP